jgi:hypothetical protein
MLCGQEELEKEVFASLYTSQVDIVKAAIAYVD